MLVPLVGGIGAVLALGWELGEYALFISGGKEAGGAYRDTLGDETLGTSGAQAAATASSSATRTGNQTVKQEPSPTALSTATDPP